MGLAKGSENGDLCLEKNTQGFGFFSKHLVHSRLGCSPNVSQERLIAPTTGTPKHSLPHKHNPSAPTSKHMAQVANQHAWCVLEQQLVSTVPCSVMQLAIERGCLTVQGTCSHAACFMHAAPLRCVCGVGGGGHEVLKGEMGRRQLVRMVSLCHLAVYA